MYSFKEEKIFFFIWFHKLISDILLRIMDLFLLSTAEILDFLFFLLSTLSALNEFLQNSNFVMMIMRDFSTTKKF